MGDRDSDFLTHRPLVLRLAYDVTGSWTDAEDIAQTAYERWVGATQVDNPRAYLAKIAVNLALDLTRSSRRREYPGPFLPEPLPTYAPAGTTGDGAAAAEQAAEVSSALLLVLESLTPLERAVLILGDVFGYRHAEIATMLDRSPESIRQLARRARASIEARRPRANPPPQQVAAALTEFLAAARGGDLSGLMRLLAPEVELISDGGGVVRAARKPIVGPAKVARFVLGTLPQAGGLVTVEPARLSGLPGIIVRVDGKLDTAGWIEFGEAGTIRRLHLVRNPAKLRWLETAES